MLQASFKLILYFLTASFFLLTNYVADPPTPPNQLPPPPSYAMNHNGEYTVSNFTGLITNGSFTVGPDGSANFSVPLKVPKGTAGVSPSLGVQYSSNAGNGILGLGWSMSGLSAISRCGSNLAQDGKIRGIKFDNQDNLCLDGQRLKLSSGTHMGSNAVYVTEMMSFSKIVAHGTAGSGPEKFEVFSSDGSVAQYGYTADSSFEAQGKSDVYIWSINKATNAQGVAINYNYEGDDYEFRLKGIEYGGQKSSPDLVKVSFGYGINPVTQYHKSFLAGSEFHSTQQLTGVTATVNDGSTDVKVLDYSFKYASADAKISALSEIEECHYNATGSGCLPSIKFSGGTTKTIDNVFVDKTSEWDTNTPEDNIHFVHDTHSSNLYILQHLGTSGDFSYELASIGDVNGDGLPDFYRADTNQVKLNNGKGFDPIISTWSNSDVIPITGVTEKVTNASSKYTHTFVPTGGPLEIFPRTGYEIRSASFTSLMDLNGDGLLDQFNPKDNIVRFGKSTVSNPFGFESSNGTWSNMQILHDDPSYYQNIIDTFIAATPVDLRYSFYQNILSNLNNHQCLTACISQSLVDKTIYTDLNIEFRSGNTSKTMIDLNGDGLIDGYDGEYFYENSGNGFLAGQAFHIPNHDFLDPLSVASPQVVTRPIIGSSFENNQTEGLIDINGDGLPDYVRVADNQVWFNTGSAFQTTSVTWENMEFINSTTDTDSGAAFVKTTGSWMDINGDGLIDIVRIVKNGSYDEIQVKHNLGYKFEDQFTIYSKTLSSNLFETGLTKTKTANDGALTHALMDLNGDGALDFIKLDGYGTDDIKVLINQQVRTYRNINKIFTGKDTISINYKALSENNYVKTASNIAGMSVVSSYSTSNGVGGQFTQKYQYQNAKVDRGGRGFLGFEKVRTFNVDTKSLSQVSYRQDYPYIGSVSETHEYIDETETSFSNWDTNPTNLVKETTQTWSSMDASTASANNTTSLLPYISRSEEISYKVGDPVNEISDADTIFEYYGDGYIKKSTAFFSGESYSKVIDYVYDSFPGNLITGKVKNLSTTVTLGGPGETRTSEFQYYKTGSKIGLLEIEYLEKGKGGTLEHATKYEYNDYGVQLEKYTYSPDDPQATKRGEASKYDSNNRFLEESYKITPTSTTTLLSKVIDIDYVTGLITKVEDSNGFETSSKFDVFGRVIESTAFTGLTTFLTSTNQTYDCTSGDNITNCAYRETTTDPEGVSASTYYDQLGRVRRVKTTSFKDDNSLYNVCSDTEYNALGQVYRKSKAYECGSLASAEWIVHKYEADKARRLEFLEEPSNGGIITTKYVYDGLTTTIIVDFGGKNQSTVTVKNIHGQIVSVTDSLGYTKNYTYDVFGNLKTVSTSSGDSDSTEMTYNIRGHKTEMNDQDMGIWKYEYNFRGELVRQWDAKTLLSSSPTSPTVSMVYDDWGRLVKRIDREDSHYVTTTWNYDNGPTGTNTFGKLLDVSTSEIFKGYTKKSFAYDSFGRTKSTTISIGANDYTITNYYDDYHKQSRVEYPKGFATNFVYKSGELHKVLDDDNNVIWKLNKKKVNGQIEQESFSTDKILKDYTYYSGSERLHTAKTTKVSGSTLIQDQFYKWFKEGNLEARSDLVNGMVQSFKYDNNNRLEQSTTNGTTKNFEYHGNGSIQTKNGVLYTYDLTKRHAVTQVGSTSYTYDDNGNIISSGNKIVDWYSFNKPRSMSRGNYSAQFYYGTNRELIRKEIRKRAITENDQTAVHIQEKIHYIGGIFELVQKRDDFARRYNNHYNNYINVNGRTIAVYRQNITTPTLSEYEYHFNDHLGSLTLITNELGVPNSPNFSSQEFQYDSWGKRIETDGDDPSGEIDPAVSTDHGYTGHKDIPNFGFIYMNARIYDPEIGRFLSPDSIVQDPYDPQTFNRYTYVRNNPLLYTDPTGHIFGIGRALKKAFRAIKPYIGTAIGIWLGGGFGGGMHFSAFWAGAGGGAAGAAINGSSIWKGALMGGITARAFAIAGHGSQLGHSFSGATKVGRHILFGGAASGINSVIDGGKFGQGAVTGGLSAGLAAQFGGNGYANRAVLGGIGGGVASKIYGGSFNDGFTDGAIQGAVAYAFNDLGEPENVTTGKDLKNLENGTYLATYEFDGKVAHVMAFNVNEGEISSANFGVAEENRGISTIYGTDKGEFFPITDKTSLAGFTVERITDVKGSTYKNNFKTFNKRWGSSYRLGDRSCVSCTASFLRNYGGLNYIPYKSHPLRPSDFRNLIKYRTVVGPSKRPNFTVPNVKRYGREYSR